MSSTCPPTRELESFALGDVSGTHLDRIAEHLGACPRCEAELRKLDRTADELTVELQRIKVDPLEHGSRLGRYELEAELGMGSFGHVFLARDTELDRRVAVKIQRAGRFASAEEVERFLREARSVASLNHPGIVPVHDTGRTADDVCYLVSEYVEGSSLEERLREGRLDPSETARVVAEIADALAYAHEHGVVHRDVKTSNILLDRDGKPRVVDFGLAKQDTGETMTSDGRVMGTPAYMSPEQARGESHRVDARSDIYSLGVILYEALTGERPFQGNGRMLLLQLLEDEPRPPRQLATGVPRDLETICLKAIAKSPGRRYQRASELAEDLRRTLRGEPIKARRVGYLERLWRWCRRYPLPAGLLVAGPIGTLAGLWHLSGVSEEYVQQTALDGTRMEADMLEKINTYYSEEVVGRLDWQQIPVTHQYRHTPQSLPLPFTFMIDAGQRISEDETGMDVRIYSEYPWREDGGPKDEFQRTAIRHLRDEVASGSGDRSYHEFTEIDGRPVLRYTRAQVMQESCKKCHNQHEQSPKRDWVEGDLAGVLEITRPLERDVARTRDGLRGAFHLIVALAVGLTGISLVLFRVSRRRAPGRGDA